MIPSSKLSATMPMTRLLNPIGAQWRILGAAFLAVGVALAPGMPAFAAGMTLNESGSTLLYPLFKLWIPAYAVGKPDVTINAAATGSGEGIRLAIAGSAQIGTSDAYMSDEEVARNPQVVNIPLAISAQTINYNVPGLDGRALKLDGPVLAGIYSGSIRQWNAPAIAALNPGVRLPAQEIIPVRRSDASGDTFVFTQFLGFSTPEWEDGIGYGTNVAWPAVSGEIAAAGNAGMLKTISQTPYSIAYLGISFSSGVAKAGLGTAMLKNQSGNFVVPTTETVDAAASTLDPRTPADERLSLVYAPGQNSYPLVNYEYAVVSTSHSDPATAAAIRQFLLWSIMPDGGNAATYLGAVGFIPLPNFIRALSENQINRIM